MHVQHCPSINLSVKQFMLLGMTQLLTSMGCCPQVDGILLRPPLDIACQSPTNRVCNVDVPFAGMAVGLQGLLDKAQQGLRSKMSEEDDWDLRCGTLVVHLPHNACRQQIARAIPPSASAWYTSADRMHGQVLGLTLYVWFD